jgi:hypothetical protein
VADFGDVGRQAVAALLRVGETSVCDLIPVLGIPAGQPRANIAYRSMAASPRFSTEKPSLDVSATISGGTPNARAAVFRDGSFAYYIRISDTGAFTLYGMDDGRWQVAECAGGASEWAIDVSGAATSVTKLTSALHTIPIGSRLLTVKNGKLVAVTPT